MTGPGCSLCIDAENIVYQALEGHDYPFERFDITQSLQTKKRYGLRIPVLVMLTAEGTGRDVDECIGEHVGENSGENWELFWPFDVTDVRRFALSTH